MNKYILLTLLLFLHFHISCQICKGNNVKYTSNVNVLNEKLDTLSICEIENCFRNFWIEFQNGVKSRDKKMVKNSLYYPIFAINLVDFEDACECDSNRYIDEYEKFNNVLITDLNIEEYQKLFFTDNLTNVINQIPFESFGNVEFDSKEGEYYCVYTVRPSELGISKCPNDGFLRFILLKKDKVIKLRLLGLY